MLPLEGVRVLDLSRLLPGPYCTLLLADLGADVIKIEEPVGGDYLRHMGPGADDSSGMFEALNRGKRSVALDLRAPRGAELLRKLAARFDVLVESFRPGTLERLGLGFEALSAANPRLVVCSMSGYGSSGPLRDRAGHDLDYIARSGVLGYGGEPGGAPAMPGAQIADIGGALMAAVGILAALREREVTGRGRRVDVALCESSLPFIHMHLGARLALGAQGAPIGRGEVLNGGYPCYRVYRTRDGRHVALAALEPKFWQGFCAAVKREDLAGAGWATGEEGLRVREQVAAIIASRTQAEWEAFNAEHDVCVEPVREGDEILADPALTARGAFFELEGGAGRQIATPLHFGPPAGRPAPKLGEHTAQVLAEAGLSAAELGALREAGVIT